jgi:hypothetical protein
MGQAQTQEYAQAAGRKFVVFLCNWTFANKPHNIL